MPTVLEKPTKKREATPAPRQGHGFALRGGDGSLRLDASGGEGEQVSTGGGPQRFKGVAYTGAVVARWYGALCIDLAGLISPTNGKKSPVLLEHGFTSEWSNVGFADSFENDGKTLTIGGALLSNETAQQVLSDMKDGFPWEQSVGVDFLKVEELAAGVTETINGRPVSGPCYVVRASRLREVSFVQQGADADTETELVQLAAFGIEPRPSTGDSLMSLKNITLDQLRTERPDLVTELSKPAAPDTTPATFEQLSAIPGASDSFVCASLKAKHTVAQANEALTADLRKKIEGHAAELTKLTETHAAEVKALNEKLATANAAAGLGENKTEGTLANIDPSKASLNADGTPKAGKPFAGALGQDPDADWKNSAALREHWKDKGGEKKFKTFARLQKGIGAAWNVPQEA